MAEIQITTTQNVNLNFKAADVGHRILAWLIDVLIKSSYIGFFAYLFFSVFKFGEALDVSDNWSVIAVIIVFLIPVIFYTITLETLLNGQTIGKKVMKIKVLKIDGYQSGFIDFFIRWVMRIVDVNLFSGVLALVLIGSSKKSQRLGGIASGTAVVSLRNEINISHTILEENLASNYQPTYASVVKLSDNDVRIIKEYYLRAIDKNEHDVLLKLKDKIISVTNQQPLENQDTKQFIDTIIKDYNHYTQYM